MATIAFDTHKPIPTAHIEAELATTSDLQALKPTLRSDIRQLEYRLVIKLGAMMMATVAAVAALVTLL